jgi:hypothetical protein
VEQEAVLRLQPVHHQGGQRLEIAFGAFDAGEAGLARGIGRAVADGEGPDVAARVQGREGAHAVGAGEQERLHIGEVDLGIAEVLDLEHRLDQHLDAALLKSIGERLGVFDGSRDQDAHRSHYSEGKMELTPGNRDQPCP